VTVAAVHSVGHDCGADDRRLLGDDCVGGRNNRG